MSSVHAATELKSSFGRRMLLPFLSFLSKSPVNPAF